MNGIRPRTLKYGPWDGPQGPDIGLFLAYKREIALFGPIGPLGPDMGPWGPYRALYRGLSRIWPYLALLGPWGRIWPIPGFIEK